MPRSVYIAGPMTGIEEYNYPAFHEAAARWRDAGWTVFNPAEHTLPTAEQEASLTADEIRALYMRKDIEWVMASDAVALLPGWQASKGAQAEVTVARVLNLPLLDAETFAPIVEVFVALDDAGPQVRVTDSGSGGQKGRNLLRYGLIPWEMLRALARHYGIGALKYDDNNWRKGYDWSLSIDALQRHFEAWRGGESVTVERFDKDGTSYAIETHHLIAVVWQATTLYIFERFGIGTDDRP